MDTTKKNHFSHQFHVSQAWFSEILDLRSVFECLEQGCADTRMKAPNQRKILYIPVAYSGPGDYMLRAITYHNQKLLLKGCSWMCFTGAANNDDKGVNDSMPGSNQASPFVL